MKNGVVKVLFTKGFGNNVFQYVYGRLLAETHKMKYSHPAIPALNIPAKSVKLNSKLKTKKIKITSKRGNSDDNVFHKFLKSKSKCNYILFGYFEDYTLYAPNLDRIRKWFEPIDQTNSTDLVMHLRLQNRLVQASHAKNFIPAEVYKRAIEQFDFNKLYIVSDCTKWDYIDEGDVGRLRSKFKDVTKTGFAPKSVTISYMNSLVDCFKPYQPEIRNSKKFIDDFNFIRSFDKILFKDSTFSWWAAVLSHASKVGVYGPWKPNKELRNKNLGHTAYPGWFSWGEE